MLGLFTFSFRGYLDVRFAGKYYNRVEIDSTCSRFKSSSNWIQIGGFVAELVVNQDVDWFLGLLTCSVSLTTLLMYFHCIAELVVNQDELVVFLDYIAYVQSLYCLTRSLPYAHSLSCLTCSVSWTLLPLFSVIRASLTYFIVHVIVYQLLIYCSCHYLYRLTSANELRYILHCESVGCR